MGQEIPKRKPQKMKPWASPLFLATVSILVMILMGPVQDTGDDAMTAWQLSRGIGSLASFISPYLSLFFSALYEAVPQLAWWSICLAFGGWAVLWTGYRFVSARYTGFCRIYFMFAWFFVVWIAVMKTMNFTRTGTALALAGGLLVAEAVLYRRGTRCNTAAYYIVGVLLFLLGSMVRFYAALLAVPYLLAILAYVCYKENKFKFKGLVCKQNVVRGLEILVPIVLAVAVFQGGAAFVNADPQWKEYGEFNKSRSEIIDFVSEYPTWDAAKEQYQAIGIEKEDFELMFNYAYLGDTDVYTLDRMHQIETLRGAEETVPVKLYQAALKLMDMLKEGRIFWYALVLGMFLFLTLGKKILLPFFVTGAGSMIMLGYFCYSGRVMLRVWEPMMMCFVAVMLFLFENRTEKETVREYMVAVSHTEDNSERTLAKLLLNDKILLVLISVILAVSWGVVQPFAALSVPSAQTDRDAVARERADYINAHRDNLYLLAVPLIHHSPNPGYFGLWEGIPKDYCTNYFALGNWDARTPANLDRYAAIGIENPTTALLNRTDTYSDYNYALHCFLQLHYGENITCSTVARYDDGGAIVQYTAPIDSACIQENENAKITWIISQYVQDCGRDAWIFEGNVDSLDLTEYDAVYCNLVVNEVEYTYRLGVKGKNEFTACMYGVPESYGGENPVATLFALQKNEKYTLLGTIPLVLQ